MRRVLLLLALAAFATAQDRSLKRLEREIAGLNVAQDIIYKVPLLQ